MCVGLLLSFVFISFLSGMSMFMLIVFVCLFVYLLFVCLLSKIIREYK